MVNQKKKKKLQRKNVFFKTHVKPIFHVYSLENIRKHKPLGGFMFMVYGLCCQMQSGNIDLELTC